MEILQFIDTKTVPDIVHDYNPRIRDNCVPIVIDNGSYMCRVGWSIDDQPSLQFRNLIAKPRRERSKKDTVEIPQTPQLQVGNDIVNIEAVRFQLKTQFDRNVVTHFEAQEHLFDYAFSHLGINTENAINHPILCTEAFLNPNSSRQLMSELLFECYNVPGFCYGIDGLLGYHFPETLPRKKSNYALIVNLGYQACHVIPVVDNQTIFENTRRLNIGGFHIIYFLHRLLQLKYPVHATAITLSRVEELLQTLCKVAVDYRDELNKWANAEFYEANVKRIQLPFTVSAVNSAATSEQQKERKRELARRLIEINARKREERLAEDEGKLDKLLNIKEMIELGADGETVERALIDFQIKNVSDLEKSIFQLNNKIEKTRQKILAAASNVDEVEEPPPKQSKFARISFENDQEMSVFLQNVRRMRQEILNKKMVRKQRKQDMAKRRTAAGQERMRIISQLARKEKGNDDFGMRDEDWDIYKTISKDGGDSDSEAENEKLLEFDEILRTYEPSELGESSQPGEAHQLHIGVEMYRGPELLFKPYMQGCQEAGLSEVIAYVLSLFDNDIQLKLADNVIITGGLANICGMKERILTDLISVRPFKSFVDVAVMPTPSLASWYGARNFSRTENFNNSLVTRTMYQEFGSEYFRTHVASNPYDPSPCSANIQSEVPNNQGSE